MDAPVVIASAALGIAVLTLIAGVISGHRGADRDWVQSLQSRVERCEDEREHWESERVRLNTMVVDLTQQLLAAQREGR